MSNFNTCRLACQTYHWKPFVKLWNWTFPGIKVPWIDVFDVRHSKEEVVLSFEITKSLISLDPFFMMEMLNRFPFFLKLTVLRDNYWIQRFDPKKVDNTVWDDCMTIRGHRYRTLPNWISFMFSFPSWQSNIHNANPRLWNLAPHSRKAQRLVHDLCLSTNPDSSF